MNELIAQILKENLISPETKIMTDSGKQTAFYYLENAINGALDDIEEQME